MTKFGMVLVLLAILLAPRPCFGEEALAAVYIGGKLDAFGLPVGGKYGFINKAGEFVIKPQFDDARDFSEGLAVVRTGDKVVDGMYRFGMYRFINRKGEFVTKQFVSVGSFSNPSLRRSIRDQLVF